MLAQSRDWFGSVVDGWEHLKTFHVRYALPDQRPPALSPVEKPAQVSDRLTVTYRYQVQTTVQLGAQELESDTLGQLERALSDRLVPSLFNGGEDCTAITSQNLDDEGARRRTKNRFLQGLVGVATIADGGLVEYGEFHAAILPNQFVCRYSWR